MLVKVLIREGVSMNLLNLLKKEITQQDLLNYYNANINFQYLPKGINGFIFQYENIYNIFVNKSLSYYKRKKTIIHEIAHLELNQLNQCNKDLFALHVDKYEDEADRYVKFLLESMEEF